MGLTVDQDLSIYVQCCHPWKKAMLHQSFLSPGIPVVEDFGKILLIILKIGCFKEPFCNVL